MRDVWVPKALECLRRREFGATWAAVISSNALSLYPAMLPTRRPDLRVGARGLLVRFVLERQAKPYAVAGHRAVLDGYVLTHDFCDA